jgi:predicted acyltransferase
VNASLAFALAHVLLFWGLSLALYRRGIIIKL